MAPAAPAKTVESVPADGSRLIVELPAAATLVINGQQTTSVGDTRTFAGNALAEDKKYEYKLAIAIDGPDGREEYTRTVWLTAGRTETVSFHAAVAETARKRAAAIAAAREAQDTPETAAAPTDLTAR